MSNIWIRHYMVLGVLIILLFFNIGLKAQRHRIIVDSSVLIIDASVSPYNQLFPGDTIFFLAGPRKYLLVRNFQGEYENPFVFTNLNGKVTVNTDHYFGFLFEHCRYIKLTGSGDTASFYGFMIERVENGAGISFNELCSDYEIDHISIENVLISGIYAKTDPDCSFTSTRENFTQFNTIIHDNYIAGTGNEGMYIGSTKYFGQTVNCNGKDTLLLPSLLDGVKIYSNIINYPGWDGIQVSSASKNCQVYDNLIMNDSQAMISGQMSGIILGGGSKCDCYNNCVSDGKGDGIEIHGLGGSRIFNNVIVNAGRTFYPEDLQQMKYGIFVTDVSMQQDSSVFLLFNDIVNPKSDGIRFLSVKSKNNLAASNVIINPGNYDFYQNGHTNFNGEDSYVMIPNSATDILLKNNYFRRTPDSAGFAATNYSLVPGSPLIDEAYPDNKQVYFDFYHHARPFGPGYDIGAFEFNPAWLQIENDQFDPGNYPIPYPDPARNKLTIKYVITNSSVVVLDIYNLRGRIIFHDNQGLTAAGNNKLTLDVDKFPVGVYLYTLRMEGRAVSGRFVKIK
ncbi:MAG: right-handed parallel beta-helix repeat-containing protein [Bacteroidetes bacterium]|nr:right-handed parallel beta-helix repeat-containing protein [Bacteroidota bacterium]